MNKDKKNEILEKINDVFVNDFNTIKMSQEKINDYLKLFDINETYNYNNFCIDFINISSNILENITEEEFSKKSVDYFITEILYEMVKAKIKNSNIEDSNKTVALMKLEVDKYMMTKNIDK